MHRFLLFFLLLPVLLLARPVEFTFEVARPADANQSPFLREVFAEVGMPDGKTLTLPAFARDKGFSVRLYPLEGGTYKLIAASERIDGNVRPLPMRGSVQAVTVPEGYPDLFVRIDPKRPLHFIRGGNPFIPIGANLPWSIGPVKGYYPRNFALFKKESLNWARVWMAHWAGMNLDWLPPEMGPSPVPGYIDSRVAETWDEIVQAAERNGIAFQLVLQHHGQIGKTVNPNWNENPWNAAMPHGFLAEPADFFTSKQARDITRAKYRYIVARWGYSPSIMAWELFNELHNTEPFRAQPMDHEVAADWHAEMAEYIRSIDVHRHLVTTSLDDLESPVYSKMDYIQPHLYSPQMVLATQHIPSDKQKRRKPVFFGEIGDDQVEVPAEVKAKGDTLLPPVWSSLMSDAEQPGQTWYVERLIQHGRLDELGSVARFISESQLGDAGDLRHFSPIVECERSVPLRVPGTLWWHRHPPMTLKLPLDGRVPPDVALFPKALVSARNKQEGGFPTSASIEMELPENTHAEVTLGPSNTPGGTAVIRIDGRQVAEQTWTQETHASHFTHRLELPAGQRTLTIESTGADWFHIQGVRFDHEVPALAAVGKRNKNFIMCWLWAREDGRNLEPVVGSLRLENVPAGNWKVVWWNTAKGEPSETSALHHAGGTLLLKTPAVESHVAVYLQRVGS